VPALGSWTYLVIPDDKSDLRMKIGKTTLRDPWNRKSQLETQAGTKLQWFGFIRDSMHEKPLHRHLKRWRRPRGEWFDVTGEMLVATNEYLQQHGELGEPYEIAEPSIIPVAISEHTFAVQPTLPGFPYRRRAKSHLLRATLDGHSIPTTAATGCVDYYTPSIYVESARYVMKGIDLDPASCDEANETVKARIHYTVTDDGLKQEWHGRVFMNPPWSGGAKPFVHLLLQSYRAGTVTEAILLVPQAYVDRSYMATLVNCFPVCFTDHRIAYGGAGKNLKTGTGNDAFYYLGPNRQRFVDEFSKHGPVLLRQMTSEEMALARAAE
jgi:hypothetical protein